MADEEYTGIDLVVEYNTVDISGLARSARVAEDAGEPEEYDITHKGDTAKQILEGLPEAPKTRVEYNCLDETLGASALLDFAINAKDTLLIYPEGKTHTYPLLTLNNARLVNRSQPIEWNAPVPLDATFVAKNSLTRSSYSTVV